MRPFLWSQKREQAARSVAQGEGTSAEIAARLGIAPETLERWQQHSEFQARVRCHLEAALTQGIAERLNRVRALDDRWLRMRRIIAERAVSAEMQGVPGGTSGLLTHTVKGVGGGENFQMVNEYAVDTGLLRELREVEKQAAQEMGQWTEKHEHTAAENGPISLDATLDELRKLPPDELIRLHRESLGALADVGEE
jgi:transposase-like protein